MIHTPAHKQKDPKKKPGQIVSAKEPRGLTEKQFKALKPGDKLIASPDDLFTLDKDKVYTVAAIDGRRIIVNEPYRSGAKPALGLFPNRFLLYKEPKPKRNYVEDHARRSLRAAGLSPTEARNVVKALARNAELWLREKHYPAVDERAKPLVKDGIVSLHKMGRGLRGVPVHVVIGEGFGWYDSDQELKLPYGYFGSLHGKYADKHDKEFVPAKP